MNVKREDKTAGQDNKDPNNGSADNRNSSSGNSTIITDNHELLSDGSASAFEGTEFRDNRDREQERKSIDDRKKNYPSGLSDY